MTLTEFSYYFRKLLPVIILFFLVILIFFYAIKVFLLLMVSHKPKTTAINPIFKEITIPNFPQNESSSNSAVLEYSLDTIEGEPITSTDTAKVFFLPKIPVRLSYREKIYIVAKAFGFDTEVVKHRLDNNTAIFEDGRQRLLVDISDFNFTYEYYLENDAAIFDKTLTPEKNESENKAIDFLRSVGRYPDELAQGKTNTIFLSYNKESKNLTILEDNQNANLVEVDFYRPDIEDVPVVTPKYYNSQNYVVMIMTENGYRVIKAQIKHYERSNDQVGTYPLTTGRDAYEALKSGKAAIIAAPPDTKNIIIKKMFLAYYDPDQYQEYFQPVYVFLGENNFVAYVTAIHRSYLIQ